MASLSRSETNLSSTKHEESPAAIEVHERLLREEKTFGRPRGYEGSVKARMVREDDLVIDAGLPPPLRRFPKFIVLLSWRAQSA